MKIIYNKNPLYTVVELDEHEKKELWYKIKIEEMGELLFDAYFHLDEKSKWFSLETVKKAVDPKYYLPEDDEKTKLDERCDMLLDGLPKQRTLTIGL